MPTAPLITIHPLDDLRCKFIVDRQVADAGVHKYTSAAEASDAPVAQAVLGVPSVCEVVVSGNVITAIQDGTLPWSAIEPQVMYAVEIGLLQMDRPSEAMTDVDDDDAFDIVAQIFEAEINPAVAQHGGKIELIDVQDRVVVVRMMGGCQGCGMADVTLRQGIETTLKRSMPGIEGLKDITDHASGANPYFQAEKK